MNGLLAVLGLAGPLSLIVASLVIALLSQRLGSITKQVRAYRWFFVAVGVMTLAIITQLWAPDPVNNVIYPLLMAFGLTIAVAAAWYYWGWLLSENKNHQHPMNAGHANVNQGPSQ